MKRTALISLALVLVSLGLGGCPSPYTLGFPGAYPTAHYDIDFQPGIPITVFYPDVPDQDNNFPVVIINTGWNQPRGSYEGYATQLAQWGYIAVIRSYPDLALLKISEDDFLVHVHQSSAILDWCAEENKREGSPLFGKVDTRKAGATGHSLGAGVSIRTALLEPRVVASVSLDSTFLTQILQPYKPMFESTDAAMMYIRSGSGGWCARPPKSGGPLFDVTNAPTVEVTVIGADHMDFEDSLIGLDYFGQVFCPSGPADPQEVRDISTRYMVAWFNVYLKGMDEFKTYYDGPKADADVESGLVTIRTRLE